MTSIKQHVRHKCRASVRFLRVPIFCTSALNSVNGNTAPSLCISVSIRKLLSGNILGRIQRDLVDWDGIICPRVLDAIPEERTQPDRQEVNCIPPAIFTLSRGPRNGE